jgi:Cu(I)/Ag(I) efflux system membrane fusion protein
VFIDPVLDPVTRVSKVRVEINNHSGKLKPEMFAMGIVDADLTEFKNNFIIPRSAVLWTGKRSVVYVKQSGSDEPIFKIREVELGPMLGNSYVIISGLSEGEEIVTQGTFSVDAAAQLEGKPSMMNNADPAKSTENTDALTGMNHGKAPNKLKEKKHIQHTQFKVSGNCEMCKERIETTAKSAKGVISAVWDVQSKQIHIEYDELKTNSMAIHKAIAKAGHDTDLEKASDDIYKKLPECCLYRQ